MDDLKKRALDYHQFPIPGKLSVESSKPCATQDDLSLAYTPGVAEPVREINSDPANAYKYTNKGNLVAVITDGTAVLGLGNMGALASKPVMEGKAVLFKRFAGIDVFDIEINASSPDEFIQTVVNIAPTFGGINLEDIAAPHCFYIENELKTYSKTISFPYAMEEYFDGLKQALMDYLQTIDISLMNKDSKAYELIFDMAQEDCKILDFNYTGSTKYILQELGMTSFRIQERLVQVHGSLEKKDIIFGVEDNAEIDLQNHIFLKKSTSQNFYGFNITNFLQPHSHLHIFGHSLGESDRTYFQPYFDETLNSNIFKTFNHKKSRVSLYYYGQPSWNKLMSQIGAMTAQKNNVYKQKVELIPIDTSV